MESNDESKDIDIKNNTCFYFDDIIKIEDFDIMLIHYKSLGIRFDKIDGRIRVADGTGYLVLFWSENYHSVYDRIKCLINVKSGIKYIISHNHSTNRVDSYESLPLEKIMIFCNVIILIKSVWNKDKKIITTIYF